MSYIYVPSHNHNRISCFNIAVNALKEEASLVWGPFSRHSNPQNLYMQNPADPFYMYTEKHQQRPVFRQVPTGNCHSKESTQYYFFFFFINLNPAP